MAAPNGTTVIGEGVDGEVAAHRRRAGGIEFVASCLSIRDQILHPTINQTTPDPECDLDYVPNKAQKAKVETCVSNSLGFGGHNTSVVVKKFKG